MSFIPINGMPGVGATVQSQPRDVLAGNVQFAQYIPGNKVLSGADTSDPGNVNEDGSYKGAK